MADVDGQRCIIATGATQRFPMRPQQGVTLDDYLFALKKMQGDFQKAKKVIVIGAGPVGLEIAGVSRSSIPKSRGSIAQRILFNAPACRKSRPTVNLDSPSLWYTMVRTSSTPKYPPPRKPLPPICSATTTLQQL